MFESADEVSLELMITMSISSILRFNDLVLFFFRHRDFKWSSSWNCSLEKANEQIWFDLWFYWMRTFKRSCWFFYWSFLIYFFSCTFWAYGLVSFSSFFVDFLSLASYAIKTNWTKLTVIRPEMQWISPFSFFAYSTTAKK